MAPTENKALADLYRCFQTFYREGKFADCEIQCKSQEEENRASHPTIKTHRYVLAAASNKLKDLLVEAEASDRDHATIVLDLDHGAVKTAVDLMYEVLAGGTPTLPVSPGVSETLAFLGIQLCLPRAKVCRKATPEEIAKIVAALKKNKAFPNKSVKKIVILRNPQQPPLKRPLESKGKNIIHFAGARTFYHRTLYHRTLYHGHFITRPLYHADT